MTFLELIGQRCVVSWKDKTEEAYVVVGIDATNRMLKLSMVLDAGEQKVFWAAMDSISGIGLASEDSRYASEVATT